MATETVSLAELETRLAAVPDLLGAIASRLSAARHLLVADEDGKNIDGARALIEQAGAMADAGANGLGRTPLASPDEWAYSLYERSTLAVICLTEI